VDFFPFDTLEAQVAKPERWTPTPNNPSAEPLSAALASVQLSKPSSSSLEPHPASHITVPKINSEANPLKKIDLSTALQYGTADGYPPLRSFVRQFTRNHLHPTVPYLNGPEVILTSGSTDGFSKAVELIVEPWRDDKDPVETRPAMLCEVFVYMNGPATVKPKGVRLVPVEIDDEGMMAHGPGGLQDIMENWDLRDGRRPHFIYTVTMGHNPTSGVLSVQRRKDIYAICQKYDIIIVEDDPYWYLQYPSAAAGEAQSRGLPVPQQTSTYKPPKSSGYEFIDSLVPSYLSIDTDGRVIRLDTFSKTVAPGCRLGWITAQPVFIERLLRIAETTTQQPSGFVQSMVAEAIMGPQPELIQRSFFSLSRQDKLVFEGWQMDGWVRWVAGLRGTYERRMQRMSSILDEHSYQLKQSTPVRDADADWGVITKTRLMSFNWPRGGMFIWLRIHFEEHPLWQAKGKSVPLLDGPALSTGLMSFLTHKPWVVLSAPGLMFSTTPGIDAERGWRFFRLCFAAEAEELIDDCSHRYGQAVQKFFRIKSIEEMEKLVHEMKGDEALTEMEGVANLSTFLGC
jgi:DNA-binding transcriptional MocR family regulator